jgi:hypothetical protein
MPMQDRSHIDAEIMRVGLVAICAMLVVAVMILVG